MINEDEQLSDDEDLTLDLLIDRLDSIEEKFELDRKSLFKRAGTWGGLVALFVSVLVGGLEIHDKTVGEEQRKKEAGLERVSDNVEKLSRYSQELTTLMANGKFLEANLRVPQISSERSRLLAEIDVIAEDVLAKLDSTTLMQLSYEYALVARFPESLNFVETAIDNAESPLIQVESRRYLGRLLGTRSEVYDKIRARNVFKEALALASQSALPKPNSQSLKYGLYDTWIRVEVTDGDCEFADGLIVEFFKYITDNPIPGQNLEIINLQTNFAMNSKCRFGQAQ